MRTWSALVAIGMLLCGAVILRSLGREGPDLPRKPFSHLPLGIGKDWQGKELGMEPTILEVLQLSDYTMRVYYRKLPGSIKPEGQTTAGWNKPLFHSQQPVVSQDLVPVWVYVGYYQSQRTGSTYHSPRHCLPGAGWQLAESTTVTVPVEQGLRLKINRVLVQKGSHKRIVLYWYQDRGRVIASEYSAKVYLVWDAMTKNRTDGSLVRISVPVTTTEERAYEHGVEFIKDFWPFLRECLPSA